MLPVRVLLVQVLAPNTNPSSSSTLPRSGAKERNTTTMEFHIDGHLPEPTGGRLRRYKDGAAHTASRRAFDSSTLD